MMSNKIDTIYLMRCLTTFSLLAIVFSILTAVHLIREINGIYDNSMIELGEFKVCFCKFMKTRLFSNCLNFIGDCKRSLDQYDGLSTI